MSNVKEMIENGRAVLGIELGSTRIKAVLIDEDHNPIAVGDHEWENRLDDGIWTYTLDDIWEGLKDSYQNLAANVKEKYGVTLKKVGAMGFSGVYHHARRIYSLEADWRKGHRHWRCLRNVPD